MEFVGVAGGCFRMGSPSSETGRFNDEGPVHRVCVDGFLIGEYEVTVGQWRRFIDDTGYRTDAEKNNKLGSFSQSGNEPVTSVSYNDVQAFIKWLNRRSGSKFRLPYEAEWEYVARAGTTTARFWGNNPDGACRYANVYDIAGKRKFDRASHNCNDGYAAISPAGSFRPNGFGLYDMLGNVLEWCQDWYDSDYYSDSPLRNPHGPSSSYDSNRVARGGSWFGEPRNVRSAARMRLRPAAYLGNLGFRLVVSSGQAGR